MKLRYRGCGGVLPIEAALQASAEIKVLPEDRRAESGPKGWPADAGR